jgi:hypothetical protein
MGLPNQICILAPDHRSSFPFFCSVIPVEELRPDCSPEIQIGADFQQAGRGGAGVSPAFL